MSTLKRLICGVMTAALLLGLLPTAAFAEEAATAIRYSVLILDTSGSMSGTPATAQKKAAKKFCQSMLATEGDNYIAIVKLNSTSSTGCQFTDDIDTLEDYIDNIPASGNTNTNQALTVAGSLLAGVQEKDAIKNIVLCSDGLPQSGTTSTTGKYTSSDHSFCYKYGNACYTTATSLREEGYNIYTLGFFHSLSGTDLSFGRTLMKDIASSESQYYEVTDPDELEFAFGEIAEDITEVGETVNLSMDLDGKEAVSEKFPYSDSFFSGDTSKYNMSLAQLSLGLACSAFTYKFDKDQLDYAVEDALVEQMEFGHFQSDGYKLYRVVDKTIKEEDENGKEVEKKKKIYVYGQEDTIGSAFAVKNLSDGTPLIAVAVRGAGYTDEWVGNFEVGPTVIIGDYEYHMNFLQSAVTVLNRLNDYIGNLEADETSEYYGQDLSNAKLWITGYSRGAAVANVVSHLVRETAISANRPILNVDCDSSNKYYEFSNLGFNGDNIYSYTFATPAPVTGASLWYDKKEKIDTILENSYFVNPILGKNLNIREANIQKDQLRLYIDPYFQKKLGKRYANQFAFEEIDGAVYAIPKVNKLKPSEMDSYIHNTIGYSDFVPMVVMSDWNYSRFGDTNYLPNSTTKPEEYNEHHTGMEEKYKNLQSNCKDEDKAYATYTANDNRHIVFTELTSLLADYINGTDHYYKKYQGNIKELVHNSLDSGSGEVDIFSVFHVGDLLATSKVISNALNLLLDISPYKEMSKDLLVKMNATKNDKYTFKMGDADIKEVIKDTLAEEGSTEEDVIKEILRIFVQNNCEDLYIAYGEVPVRYDTYKYVDKFVEKLFNAIKDITHIDSFDGLISYEDDTLKIEAKQEHFPAVYLAWMLSYSANDTMSKSGYKIIKIACPTDVSVYDGNGNVLANVVNDEVQNAKIKVYVTSNHEKYLYVPEDDTIRVDITATDDGTMDVTVSSYEQEGELLNCTLYANVALTENQTFDLTVAENADGDVQLSSAGETITPDVDGEADALYVTVAATAEGSGEVNGQGVYTIGDTVVLLAEPANNSDFNGWYCDGTLVSTEAVYSFPAQKDVTLTAEFTTNNRSGRSSSHDSSVLNYTLTFQTNGGSTLSNVAKASGTQIDLAAYTPTKDGYTFAGWYSDEALTAPISKVTLSKNCTVYAKWEAETAADPVETEDGNPFTDVNKSDYFYQPVLWGVENNIVQGITATTFGPENVCTRGQMVTFLWRAFGCPEPTVTENPFTDVSADAYYYKAVLWAVEKGIAKGVTATTFDPDGIVNRAQAVTFLWRAEGNPVVEGTSFEDVVSGSYYEQAVIWAVKNSITNGTGTGFSPNADCIRGQIITFLHRDLA